MPLTIAAKVDRVDEEHLCSKIRPMIDGRHVEMIAEISNAAKPVFLSGTHVIFPSRLQRHWRKSATHPVTILYNLGQNRLQQPTLARHCSRL